MLHEIVELADLGKIDRGVVNLLFRQALERINKDIDDRSAVKGARKLVITLACEPVQGASGTLESVKVEVEVKVAAPALRTNTYSMGQNAQGHLMFNDLSPDAVGQRTLDEEIERKISDDQ